jgi:hypothetical protein
MVFGCLTLSTGLIATASAADIDHADLASRATNPGAALIQMQFQNQYTPETHNADGYANSFIIQPVIPFVMGEEHYFQSILTRVTLPIVTTPEDANGNHHSGLGDTTILVVPAHREKSKTVKGEFFQWAPVGAVVLPTATQTQTGSGKTSLGPGLFALWNKKNVFTDGDSVQIGGLFYHVWDVGGDGSRDDVSKSFAQPVFNYHFNELFGDKGWYAGTPDDLWSYDHEVDEFTTVPIGARLGKVFSIGKQPVNMFGQAWYSPADDGAYPEYGLKLNLTFLFPE